MADYPRSCPKGAQAKPPFLTRSHYLPCVAVNKYSNLSSFPKKQGLSTPEGGDVTRSAASAERGSTTVCVCLRPSAVKIILRALCVSAVKELTADTRK
jgi:hypothetical protein